MTHKHLIKLIDLALAEALRRLHRRGITDRVHREVLLAQVAGQQIAQLGVVVDDQYPEPLHRSAPRC